MASDFYKPDNNFMIPEEFVANWDAMTNLYKEYATEFISGKRDLSEFDTFVSEWYAAGGTEITQYANEIIK